MMIAMESRLKIETRSVLQWAKQVKDIEYRDPSKHWIYRIFRIKRLRQSDKYERANAVVYLIENCGAELTMVQAWHVILKELVDDKDFWNGARSKSFELQNKRPLEMRRMDDGNLH